MAKVIGTVQSASSDRSYNILMSSRATVSAGETIYCSCPAWRYSKTSPRSCKHLSQWRARKMAPVTSTLPMRTKRRASDRERLRTAFSQLRHKHGFSVRMNTPDSAFRRVRDAAGDSVAFDRRQSKAFRANGHLGRSLWMWFRGGATAGAQLAEVMGDNGFLVDNRRRGFNETQGVFICPVSRA
jgi:hypothetical protein